MSVRRRHPSPLVPVLAVVAVVVGLAACGSDADDGPSGGRGAGEAASDLRGDLTVFAAASLTESFTELGEQFEAAHPGVDVTFNFASSSSLVQQVAEGAPADLVASADEANMARLVDAGGAAGTPVVFAHNGLEVVVAPGNPLGITGLADLADPDILFVACDPAVPIGRYAARALAAAGVSATPVSYEADVKAVVTKVTSGEADAGIVYATDVLAAGSRASGVAIPAEHDVVAAYPIVVTAAAPNPAAASAFVEHVTSEAGARTLESFGFARP